MKKKVMLIIILLLLAGGAGWFGFRIYKDYKTLKTGGKGVGREEKAVPVKSVSVGRRDMRDVRYFSGTLRAWSSFEVAPKVSGRLEQLTVSIGDRVDKGMLLARIDGEEYEQQIEQARAELKIAEAQLQESQTKLNLRKKELDRLGGLFKKQVVSEAEHDAVEAQYNTQLADVRMKESQVLFRESSLKSAQLRHSYTKIYANWEGDDDGRYVGERFVDSGAMLNANHPVMTVVEIKRLKAEIHAIERDYPLLRVGQVAEISTDAYPGQRFKGTIYRISKVLEEQSRQAEVQIEVNNADLKLKPGMYVRVAIEFGRSAGAQVLPKDALVKRDGKTGVFRVSHKLNKAFFTPVETGIAEGGDIEISAPVLSEPVAVLGQHLLSHGSVIRETEAAKDQNGGKRK